MILIGNQSDKRNYITYSLPVNRRDWKTGERLGVRNFKLRKPFLRTPLDPAGSHGRVVQGASDGSEGNLAPES